MSKAEKDKALIELDNRVIDARKLEACTYLDGRRGGECKSKLAHQRFAPCLLMPVPNSSGNNRHHNQKGAEQQQPKLQCTAGVG
jgi:hypothetical protein